MGIREDTEESGFTSDIDEASSDSESDLDDTEDLNNDECGFSQPSSSELRGELDANSILRRPNLDITAMRQLERLTKPTLLRLCRRRNMPSWTLPYVGRSVPKAGMVLSLVDWFQNGRTMHECDTISIADGLSILNSAGTATYKYTQLNALQPSVLLELCLVRGINTSQFTLAPHSTYLKPQQMIPALITSPVSEASQIPKLSLVVSEWIASHKPATQKTIQKLELISPLFNPVLQRATRRDIDKCIFPAHLTHDAPPANFGSKSHGSLKAAQWRTVCSFTMLVTLTRYWLGPNAKPHHHEWFQNYVHLTAILSIAYKRSINTHDIMEMRRHCIAYVNGLKNIFPLGFLKPSHHYLLHLADSLERFGPMPGWWAFSFERLNGFVQRTPTNNKPGEIEETFTRRMNRLGNMATFLVYTDNQMIKDFASFADGKKGEDSTDTATVSSSIRDLNRIDPATLQLCRQYMGTQIHHHPFSTLTSATHGSSLYLAESKPSKHSRVEFTGTDVFGHVTYRSLGYIKDRIKYHAGSGEPDIILLSIACYGAVDQGQLGSFDGIQARFYSNQEDCHRLFELNEVDLAHVVFFPWSTDRQLIVSTT